MIVQLKDLSKAIKYIYGPVNSWRFGRSLGIDLISQEKKLCNFNCIYCQLGEGEYVTKKGLYVKEEDIIEELMLIKNLKIDYITFSGMGEPTLAENLGSAIEKVKSLKIAPISILTNSTFLNDEKTRKDLLPADVVSCKIDAPSSSLFKKINQPKDVEFSDIISGIIEFKKIYKGRLILQMMFISLNKDKVKELKEIALKIMPDLIHINTPRRCYENLALSPYEIFKIKEEFKDFNVLSLYDKKEKDVIPLDAFETKKRRGE